MQWKLATVVAIGFQVSVAHAATTDSRAACLTKLKALSSDHNSHLVVPAQSVFAAEMQRFANIAPQAAGAIAGSPTYGVRYPIDETNATSVSNSWHFASGPDQREISISILQERFAMMNYQVDVQETWSHEEAGADQDEVITQQFDVTQSCELVLFQTTVSHRQLKDSVLTQSEQGFAGALPKVASPITQKSAQLPSDGKFFLFMNQLFGTPEFKALFVPGSPKVYISLGMNYPFISIAQAQRSSLQMKAPFAKTAVMMSGYKVGYLIEGANIDSTILQTSDHTLDLVRSSSDNWSVPAAIWSGVQIVRLDHTGDLPVTIVDGVDVNAAIKKVDLKTNVPVAYPNLSAYWQADSSKVNSARSYSHGHSRTPTRGQTTYETVLTVRDPLVYLNIKGDPPLKSNSKRDFLYSSKRAQTTAPEVVQVANEALAKSSDPKDRMAISEAIAQVLQNHVSYEYTEVNNGGRVVYQSAQQTLRMGKGVCEDFSITFAAIARHLGIPTRVISGLSLSASNVGYHAWVEVEIRDNVWVPLDPQNAMDEFDPAGYMPFGMELNDYPYADIAPNKLPEKPVTRVLETR